MDTHHTTEIAQQDRIVTPESIIAEGMRIINSAEFPNRFAWIRGIFASPYKAQNSKTAYAELVGERPENSIRLYFSDYEGNLEKFSYLVPGAEYDMTGRLSFYNNKGNVCIQLVPETVVAAKADSLAAMRKMSDDFHFMKEALYTRRKQGVKDIQRLILNALATKKRCNVILVRPNKETAEGDINAALAEARDFFHITACPCNFTNPMDMASNIRNADMTNTDIIVLARGGGQSLEKVDSEEVIRALTNLKKPLVTGLGHEENHLMAELFADKLCTTPTSVGNFLLEMYKSAKLEWQDRQQPVEVEKPVGYRNRYSETKFAKYLQPEPTFYGIRWTDRPVLKWLVWGIMLVGVFQIISWFW